MIVYVLYHNHSTEYFDDVHNIKLIGVYTDISKVNETIQKYQKFPGFIDYPDGFFYVKKTITKGTDINDIPTKVYLLEHEYEACLKEYYTLLGVYYTNKSAQDEMKYFMEKEPYKDYKDGFTIDFYTLNEDASWREGFRTV